MLGANTVNIRLSSGEHKPSLSGVIVLLCAMLLADIKVATSQFVKDSIRSLTSYSLTLSYV